METINIQIKPQWTEDMICKEAQKSAPPMYQIAGEFKFYKNPECLDTCMLLEIERIMKGDQYLLWNV